MIDNTYYLRDRNRVTGPFTVEQLQSLYSRGRLARFHQLSTDRRGWAAASEILPDLFNSETEKLDHEEVPLESRNWYYATGDDPVGPVDSGTILRLIQQGQLTTEALVWREGLQEWTQAGNLPEFSHTSIAPAPAAPPSYPTGRSPGGGSTWLIIATAIFTTLVVVLGLIYFWDDLFRTVGGNVGPIRHHDETEIEEALGLVACGWSLHGSNGVVTDLPLNTGTCFAISATGHLLTNKHVVEDTVQQQRMDQDHALRALARSLISNTKTKVLIEQAVRSLESAGAEITDDRLKNALDHEIDQEVTKMLPGMESAFLKVEPKIWVFFGDRNQVHEASPLHMSEHYDMAVLRVERRGTPYFRIQLEENAIKRGQDVYALGFPGSAMEAISKEEEVIKLTSTGLSIRSRFKSRDFEHSMTGGLISRISEEEIGRRWIQHDASISQGNSGGPLVDKDGRVLAINTLLTQGEGDAAATLYSIALPQMIDEIKPIVPSIE